MSHHSPSPKTRAAMMMALIAVMILGMVGYGCAVSKSSSESPANATKTPSSSQQASSSEQMPSLSQSPSASSDANRMGNDAKTLTPASENSFNLSDQASRSQLASEVRPEIRHILQSKFSDANELEVAMTGAGLLQHYLNHPSLDAAAIMKQYDCHVISLTQADQTLIKSLTFDTPERMAIIKAGLKNYQPPVSSEIVIDSAGNAVSPCTF